MTRSAATLLVMLAWPLAAAAAGELPPDPLPGRLFHSAAERAALDHSARGMTPPPAVTPRNPPARPPAPRPPAQSEKLNGFVLRSDGQDTYWLSGANPPPSRR